MRAVIRLHRELRTREKENPPLYGREGDLEKSRFRDFEISRLQEDVQIIFGRNRRCLFYLLTGEGVGLIASEDEDLAVGNYFLSAFRHRSQFNGLVF